MENTNKIRRSSRYLIPRTHSYQFQKTQKGALLIGLIIVMLIFSILSGAMVYLFSASTIGAAFANSSQRAYYAAEAGARYMIAQYRHTTPQMTTAQFVALSGTIDLPNNNGKAIVTITDSMAGVTVDPTTTSAETKTLDVGGTLAVNDATNFPANNGFFKIAGYPSITFRYKTRNENILQLVTGQGSTTVNVTSGVTVTAPKGQVSIVSKGFYPANSLTSRTIEYGWLLSGGQQGGKKQFHDQFNNDDNWNTAQGPGGHDVSGGAMNVTSVVVPASGTNYASWGGGNSPWAINVWKDTDTLLKQAWNDAGGCLSYDVQVKVTNTQPYWMAGLGFRLRSPNSSDVYTYGLSFIRHRLFGFLGMAFPFDGINDDDLRIPESLPSSIPFGVFYTDPYIVLWQRTGPQAGTGNFKIIAYRKITAADNLTTGTGAGMRLIDWSTLMVRLVEGYELQFTSGLVDATGKHIKYGDILQNSAGTKTAQVIGTPILTSNWGIAGSTTAAGRLVLTNVTGGGFANGESLYISGNTVTVYAVVAAAQATTKTNYIMVYYGDTAVGSGDSDPPALLFQANNVRKGNPRGTVNWPPDDWTDRANANDYLSLIRWIDYNLGTNISPSLTTGNWSYSVPNVWRIVNAATPYLEKYANGNNVTAQPATPLIITPGETYQVSFTISNGTWSGGARNCFYSLGGKTEDDNGNTMIIDHDGSYTSTITASTNGNLIFTPENRALFRISHLTVRPLIFIDTTPDSQGKAASLVQSLASATDLFHSIIKTDALISPVWTDSTSPFIPIDQISLITASSAGDSTSYDDFAVQVNAKSGAKFVPPIQQ